MLFTYNSFINYKFKYSINKKKIAKEKSFLFINKFCDNIHTDYIKKISNDNNNKILVYSINNSISHFHNEIIATIIYRIILNTPNLLRIYIPLLSIKKKMQGKGYGTLIFKELIQYFKKYKNQNIEILLLSLPSSYNFYKSLKFYKSSSKFIENTEIIDDNIIMKFFINNEKEIL